MYNRVIVEVHHVQGRVAQGEEVACPYSNKNAMLTTLSQTQVL